MIPYIYTFIRKDITPEQKIVQIGHVCYESGKLFGGMATNPNLILMIAKDEDELKLIAEKLEWTNIDYHMFYEPDNNIGFSAICTRPITDGRERAFFKKWDLYRHHD